MVCDVLPLDRWKRGFVISVMFWSMAWGMVPLDQWHDGVNGACYQSSRICGTLMLCVTIVSMTWGTYGWCVVPLHQWRNMSYHCMVWRGTWIDDMEYMFSACVTIRSLAWWGTCCGTIGSMTWIRSVVPLERWHNVVHGVCITIELMIWWGTCDHWIDECGTLYEHVLPLNQWHDKVHRLPLEQWHAYWGTCNYHWINDIMEYMVCTCVTIGSMIIWWRTSILDQWHQVCACVTIGLMIWWCSKLQISIRTFIENETKYNVQKSLLFSNS